MDEPRLAALFVPGAKLYLLAFAMVVGFKIPVTINAMAGRIWWEQTPSLARVAHFVNVVFLIAAAFRW